MSARVSPFYHLSESPKLSSTARSSTPGASVRGGDRDGSAHTTLSADSATRSDKSSEKHSTGRHDVFSAGVGVRTMVRLREGLEEKSRAARAADGQGVSTKSGHTAQAKDRDFEAAFERCRVLIGAIQGSVSSATVCRQGNADLAEIIRHVEAMLRHMSGLFHVGTAKTIVSINQLAAQLEGALKVALTYQHAEGVCGRIFGAGRKALEARGNKELSQITRAVEAFATAMLLEHGYRASDLPAFVTGTPPTIGGELSPSPHAAPASGAVPADEPSFSTRLKHSCTGQMTDGSSMGILQ